MSSVSLFQLSIYYTQVWTQPSNQLVASLRKFIEFYDLRKIRSLFRSKMRGDFRSIFFMMKMRNKFWFGMHFWKTIFAFSSLLHTVKQNWNKITGKWSVTFELTRPLIEIKKLKNIVTYGLNHLTYLERVPFFDGLFLGIFEE